MARMTEEKADALDELWTKSLSGNKAWMDGDKISPDNNGAGKLHQRPIVTRLFLIPDQQLPETVQP